MISGFVSWQLFLALYFRSSRFPGTTNRQIHICLLTKTYYKMMECPLRCPVNKISRPAEMCGLQPWIFSAISDWYEFFLKQFYNIFSNKLGKWPQVFPADMRSDAEADFVVVLCAFLCHYGLVDQDFREVVGDEPGPDFLLDVIGLIGMKIA